MSDYKKLKVGIVNLNINNIFSIYQAFKEIGCNTKIINFNEKNYNYDILVLPGDGSFSNAMNIIKKNFIDVKIYDFLSKKSKILFGVCLGMQLLFDNSYEFGNTKGLGIIRGSVKKIKKTKNIKVPHIGWNKLHLTNNKKNFIKKINNNKSFYFVHSYYCEPKIKENISALTKIGKNKFCSAVQKNNVIATQFHPEKSGVIGLEFLRSVLK